jgi:hypothetical protein
MLPSPSKLDAWITITTHHAPTLRYVKIEQELNQPVARRRYRSAHGLADLFSLLVGGQSLVVLNVIQI